MNKTIESLRTFAVENNEIAFAHLDGEEWAVERIADTMRRIDAAAQYRDANQIALKLSAVRSTDTTRPDGAIARSFTI